MACTALGGGVCGDSRSVCPATLTLVPRVFFDACDGLFTNYNWKEEHLERTRRLAGPRHTDIYVGIDVFARGDVIGGGFDTDKVGVPRLGHRGALGLPLAWGSELPPMAVPCRAMPLTQGCSGEEWGNPEPLCCQPCMERELGDAGAAVPGEGDAAAHPRGVVLPHHGASGIWGSGDRAGDKVTAWPGPCCSLLLSAVPAPDPPARPLRSHLRSRLGLRAPGGGKLPAKREQVRAAWRGGAVVGRWVQEHPGSGGLQGGRTRLPGDPGCPPGPVWPHSAPAGAVPDAVPGQQP